MRAGYLLSSLVIAPIVGMALLGSTPSAKATTVFNQSGIDPQNSYELSGVVSADDFQLAAPTTLRSFGAYIVDNVANNNGVLDAFSGTLSWGLYNNGASKPGTLIASGSATGTDLAQTDTGVQDNFNDDIVRIDANFVAPQSLDAGTYWLALHEGTWQSPTDGTPIWWSWSTNSFGSNAYKDSNETNPGSAWVAGFSNLAFTLSDTAIPEPASLGLLCGGLLLLRRRRVA